MLISKKNGMQEIFEIMEDFLAGSSKNLLENKEVFFVIIKPCG
jgi:hypothetical protein